MTTSDPTVESAAQQSTERVVSDHNITYNAAKGKVLPVIFGRIQTLVTPELTDALVPVPSENDVCQIIMIRT